MVLNYCIIIGGDSQNTLQNNVFGMNGAVQQALNQGCVLQGGVSISTWKLGNGQNMFGFVQAVLCNVPCAQVSTTAITTENMKEEIIKVTTSFDLESIPEQECTGGTICEKTS